MKSFFSFLLVLFLFSTATLSYAGDPIHQDTSLDEIVLKTNQMFLDAHFDEGIEILKEAAKTRQNSPAVSYFLMNGYWWKIFRAYIYDKESKSTEFDDDFDFY